MPGILGRVLENLCWLSLFLAAAVIWAWNEARIRWWWGGSKGEKKRGGKSR